MSINYVMDHQGEVLGVIIPIEEWDNLKIKYERLQEFEDEVNNEN